MIGATLVAQRHGMGVFVAATPDAAHQGPDPGSAIDAMDRPAPLPLRFGRQHQVVQVEVDIRPLVGLLKMKRVAHSFLPLVFRIPALRRGSLPG